MLANYILSLSCRGSRREMSRAVENILILGKLLSVTVIEVNPHEYRKGRETAPSTELLRTCLLRLPSQQA